MLKLHLAYPVLGCAAILFSHPAFQAQAFTWGPVQSINLPARTVFANLSAIDMNGDGNTDICLSLWTIDSTNTVTNFKYIYVGDGLGHFASTPVMVHESNPDYGFGTVQFFDVNGDGFPDEVYSYGGFTNSGLSHPGVFAVLLGDGKGNFTQSTSIPQELSGVSNFVDAPSILAAGSFRNNGRLDFATVFPDPSNAGHSVLTVYLNDGGGIFHVGSTLEVTSGAPLNPVTGDFNGDGHLDIAWPDGTAEPGTGNRFAIHCLNGDGDGTFGADHICYTLDGPPFGIFSASLNGDPKADLLVYAGPKVGVKGAQSRVATLLARQTGGFYWSSSVSLAPGTVNFGSTSINGLPPLNLEDLNGDGTLDMILGGEVLFAGSANGVFGSRESIAPGNFNPSYFAPLKKGGLPALFYSTNDNGDFSTKFSWQLNTSPK